MYFKDISIKNFRGIKELKVEGLSNINLFLGDNDCGKTTILEAIFLLTGMSNSELTIKVNEWRNFIIQQPEGFELMFYNRDIKENIIIQSSRTGKENRYLKIFLTSEGIISTKARQKDKDMNTALSKELEYEFRLGDKKYRASIRFNNDNKTLSLYADEKYTENLSGRFLSSNYLLGLNDFSAITSENREVELVDALKLIDKRIKNVKIAFNGIWVDIGRISLPIRCFGGGIQKILGIVGCLELDDDILMIDELENGFHFSKLPDMWKIILERTKKSKKQLFISTHSREVLESLAKVLEEREKKKDSISVYTVKKYKEGNIKAYKRSFRDTVQEGIEIRSM